MNTALERVASIEDLQSQAEQAVRLAFGTSLLPTGEQLCRWGRINRALVMISTEKSDTRRWAIKKKLVELEEETVRLADLAQAAVDELADAGGELNVPPCKCDYCRKGFGNV